jgi:TonB family protein
MTANRRCAWCAAAFLLTAAAVAPVGSAEDLTAVKALYASASYEEALSKLAAIETAENANEIEQYRALCLIALGRVSEAERSIEQLLARDPLYEIPEAAVSPRLVGLFRDVRQRVLPVAAREYYESGKRDFDASDFRAAARQFETLLAILGEVGTAADDPALIDLRRLGEGFLKLSEAAAATPPQGTPQAAARAQGAVADAAAPNSGGAPAAAPQIIYSAADATVVAPIELARELPGYSPPAGFGRQTARGILTVVISEAGTVESARLESPISPLYDRQLLSAAQKWRFRPATKDGTPVRYRTSLEIVLLPRS